MYILDIMNEYIQENEFVPHPLLDMPLDFRYTYAIGISMGIFAEKEMDFTKNLKEFYKSLKLEDKSGDIISTAKEPTKDLFVEVVKIFQKPFQKQMFILDIYKTMGIDTKVPEKIQKFLDGMIKVFQFKPTEKETLNNYKEALVNKTTEIVKILDIFMEGLDNKLIANIISYFFKPSLKTLIEEINKEIIVRIKKTNNQTGVSTNRDGGKSVINIVKSYKEIKDMLMKSVN